jgi:hypothetical protein
MNPKMLRSVVAAMPGLALVKTEDPRQFVCNDEPGFDFELAMMQFGPQTNIQH